MGLSTKQVSNDHGLDWGGLPKPPQIRRLQQQQPPPEPLDCPRCGSTNTKFCYYNNYNKLQPRHFCKACKRHWTKGGTLRNVPFGGARKNKRLKRSNCSSTTNTNTNTTAAAAANKSSINTQMGNIQIRQQIQTTCDQKSISEVLYEQQQQHDSTTMNIINGVFIGSAFLNQNLSSFPFQSLSYIDTNPCSVSNSFQSSNGYNFVGGLKSTMEDSITMPSTSSGMNVSQPWNVTTTSNLMEMPNYWNWEDIDTMVSTDLNIPWDDSDIKP